jgi:hypothetical protein
MRPYQRETIVVGMFNSFKSWNVDSFTSGRDPPRLFPVWPPLSLPVWPPRAVRFVSSHPAAASASSPPRPRRLVFSRFGRRERRARLRLFPSGHCERCGWSFPVRHHERIVSSDPATPHLHLFGGNVVRAIGRRPAVATAGCKLDFSYKQRLKHGSDLDLICIRLVKLPMRCNGRYIVNVVMTVKISIKIVILFYLPPNHVLVFFF